MPFTRPLTPGHIYYREVIDLIQRMDTVTGFMRWRAGGAGGGGQWQMGLFGRTVYVPMRDLSQNALDRLYANPRQDGCLSGTDSEEYRLADDARWRLIALFQD